ncbi:10839_t:CDS:2 [Diversispora eburnea]|uniref:10839_t:CDS:1 n=1 Tax=Diversispora eburnea TaxID=1213867 RepID=A0A9N8WI16_9GLOM|nr:10839_t:CDS:2 [Diversispora eburnea]
MTTKPTNTKPTTTKPTTTKPTTTKSTTTKSTTTKSTTTKSTTNAKTSSTTSKTSLLPTEGNGQINNLFKPFVPLPITPQPVTRYYELRLVKTTLSPDGFSRTVLTVNGQFPAPILRANEGDRIIVKVINALGRPSGIHWHGLFQNGTTWYDGATGISQCPIPDGSSFVYNFTVNQSGTYWYHAHYVVQYVDGLFGPLIIHDPKDPYKNEYDFEYVVTMNDWHHLTTDILLAVKKEPGYKGQTPVPDAALISGLGRYNCTAAPQGSICIPNAPLATYSVQKGKKYRFRLINTSSNAFFIFSIDNHPLKIIEVEGTPIQPVTVNLLPINIAQRYSVIVEANKPIGNYFIRATLAKECMDTNPFTFNVNSSINYNATGILKYQGSDNSSPNTQPFKDIIDPQCLDIDAKLLKPLKISPAPIGVTDTFVMVATLFSTAERVTFGAIDDSSFKPNFKSPTAIYLTDGNDIGELPANQNIYSYDHKNGVVQIELINDSTFHHPFHLHGHNFYLIGTGQGSTVDPNLYDFETPPIRDTVTVPKFGWVVIRFVADNPGVWGFHCHIEWHLEMGMLAQLVELPSILRLQKVPAAVKNLCSQYNSSNSTNF